MTKIIRLAAASVFAGGVACATSAPSAARDTQQTISAPTKGRTIVNQTAGGSGTGLFSQNLGVKGYNSAGADAFVIHKKATVQTVVANGKYFNGSGPATSESVTFYADSSGTPGRAIKRCTYARAKGEDNAGSFTIGLKPACNLKAGTYWVSVVANLSDAVGVEWAWDNATETGPYQGDWENPGGSGACTTWEPNQVCFPGNYPTGYNYELRGKGS
jgi:hypothetical protein